MGKRVGIFTASILVLALLVSITVFGFQVGNLRIPSAAEGIKQGLDLKGGSSITFEAQIGDDYSGDLSDDMAIVQTVLQRRLDSLNYSEATVQLVGDRRVMVEIPAVSDPEEAVQMLGKTALLEFADADGNVVISGADIESAKAEYGQLEQNGISQHYIALKLSTDAVSKFTEATKAAANRAGENKNFIAIQLDGEVQSTPFVGEEYKTTGINTAEVTITVGSGEDGTSPAQYAKDLAAIINSGRLPFNLKDIELRTVGATLGEEALSKSLTAGLIGLILVLLFMAIIYRVPGIVADIALIFYGALMVILMAIMGVNLSLPGMAGIILSIGMAVDANVIIFERIKEELRLGKTIRAGVDAGFKRAFTAILDSNITTMIAAIVLYFLGTGTIRGFAITLGLGVLVSMFTVLVVSRFLLKQLVGMNIKSLKAFGI
ncbi:MAG: protein translocase subunit SecD [Ruminococcaceae bacterium]|nr:protein translocase subunit SecD [Oscillospiraceae bacterium]